MTTSRTTHTLLAFIAALGTLAVPIGAQAADNPISPVAPSDPVTIVDPGDGTSEIVWGNNVEPGEYPFFVRIESTQNSCGATLIDPQYILTAAHCVDGGLSPSEVTARYGEFSTSRAYLRSTPVLQIQIHPGWTGNGTDGDDMALLRIAPGVIPYVPLAIGGPNESGLWDAGSPATIIGYGRTDVNNNQSFPTILQEADTHIQSDSTMSAHYGILWGWLNWWDDGGMIGAGDGGGLACYGDSGGPLLVRRGNGWMQVGIASFTDETFGNACRIPGGYTEIGDGSQLAWIGANVPSVKATWGQCEIWRNGFVFAIGRWTTTLNSNGTANLICGFVGGPSTPPHPSGPAPRVCLRKPWLCPDGPGIDDDDM
ncbi:MAG TPA: trypsin-like serine protease [Ilumatobacteraceae bacterium]|nr:trypsin-like serine protease [Ilumatobacteraceae bacterium]